MLLKKSVYRQTKWDTPATFPPPPLPITWSQSASYLTWTLQWPPHWSSCFYLCSLEALLHTSARKILPKGRAGHITPVLLTLHELPSPSLTAYIIWPISSLDSSSPTFPSHHPSLLQHAKHSSALGPLHLLLSLLGMPFPQITAGLLLSLPFSVFYNVTFTQSPRPHYLRQCPQITML